MGIHYQKKLNMLKQMGYFIALQNYIIPIIQLSAWAFYINKWRGFIHLEKQKRDFKGIWIPKEIWLSKDLTLQEKIFIVEIHSLDNEKGCFASNTYFSKFFGMTPQRCSQIINSLIKKKYIRAKYIYEGKETVLRVLNIINTYKGKFKKVSNKCEEGIKESLRGYKGKFKENNTINNPSNNTYNKEINDIVNFWNNNKPDKLSKCDKVTKKRIEIINDRIKDKNYGIDKTKEGIKNYFEVFNSDHYFTHPWSIDTFLKQDNAFPHFIKGGEKWSAYIIWYNKEFDKKERENN